MNNKGNTVFANFMGEKVDDQGMSGYDLIDLEYETSWDWLMPVVAKVRDLSKTVDEVEMDTWYEYMKECLPFADIENVYKYTLEFLEWYNNFKIKMKVQFIYTYDSREQEIINYLEVPFTIMENEKEFLKFACQEFTSEEKDDMVKISSCVSMEEEPPKWYMDCNGKFYFDPTS